MPDEVAIEVVSISWTAWSTMLKSPLVALSPFEMLSDGPRERKYVIVAPVVVNGPLVTSNENPPFSSSSAFLAGNLCQYYYYE